MASAESRRGKTMVIPVCGGNIIRSSRARSNTSDEGRDTRTGRRTYNDPDHLRVTQEFGPFLGRLDGVAALTDERGHAEARMFQAHLPGGYVARTDDDDQGSIAGSASREEVAGDVPITSSNESGDFGS